MVPLGTTYEDHFCLPLEVKPRVFAGHHWFTRWPWAPGAGQCGNQYISRWHPTSLTGGHRMPDHTLPALSSWGMGGMEGGPGNGELSWAELREPPGTDHGPCFVAPVSGSQGTQVLIPAPHTDHSQQVQALWSSVSLFVKGGARSQDLLCPRVLGCFYSVGRFGVIGIHRRPELGVP